jgi:hypothetical protein
MRDKLRAFYYPESWFEYVTLIKSILLFDEIHLMDRPSFSFYFGSPASQGFVTIGAASPLRQYEDQFRSEGIPLYVHAAPSGAMTGDLYEAVRADISDKVFLQRFQDGLRASDYFLNLYVPAGANYGKWGTQKSIAEKLVGVDLNKHDSALDVFCDPKLKPFEFATEEDCLKSLVSEAMTCSAKMNFALDISARGGFSPLADMSPFTELLKAKYGRAIRATSDERALKIPATDLSLAIMDELVPAEILHGLSMGTAIEIRKGSEKAREAFLEHLVVLQSKLDSIPDDGDYSLAIKKLINVEILPAAREFQNKLAGVTDKIVGSLAVGGASALVSSSATIAQIFGGIAWPALLAMAGVAAGAGGIYLAKEAAGAVLEKRKARRECAISYLLDLGARS